jgi:glycosyltransferase involved in cell wall biosynthesis
LKSVTSVVYDITLRAVLQAVEQSTADFDRTPVYRSCATLRTMVFVVIPALNEMDNLRVLLPYLSTMPAIARVCVVDGGSTDGTLRIARENGALALKGRAANVERNRGAQMNAGVAALRAESALGNDAVLWFLHADARPVKSNLRALLRATRDSRVCGGNFALRFDEKNLAANTFAAIARVLRKFGIYYGDSGIWLRAGVFGEIGAYPSWPLFEDYDLARRLEGYARQSGQKTRSLRPPLLVSARRWRKNPMRWLATWAKFQLLFWLGVSPFDLARRYHK